MPDHTSASPLVSAEWLRDAFERPDVVVLDASWHMPATRRDGATEFELGHIPGAAFFSIDGIADPDSTLPHMVPTAEAFAAAVGALGVGAGDHVVCYATEGIGTAPRAWWMFRLFGHERVSVLDGGLPAWTAGGGTLDKGPARPRPRAFQATFNPARIRDLAAVRANLEAATELVVDARSAGRFAGTETEPRPGLRGGHIPESVNLPYQTLLDGPRMLAPEVLRARLEAAGVAGDRSPVFTCGSGVSACTLALGLTLTGRDDWAVYDGSWSEWGGREDVPVTS
ncbi:MAG: 3-mercaptopyruvate sulfurtransferase [Rhodospirillales bacterium]|nr:3-mercaptopyruvate sulfurtransferase [Rhodospirillales bacterium]